MRVLLATAPDHCALFERVKRFLAPLRPYYSDYAQGAVPRYQMALYASVRAPHRAYLWRRRELPILPAPRFLPRFVLEQPAWDDDGQRPGQVLLEFRRG